MTHKFTKNISYMIHPCRPNSIRSILSYDLSYDLSPSETRSQTSQRPGLRLFLSKTCHRLVWDQVPDFFICRKLAARSISTCRDRSILSETRSQTFFLLKTCRRPGPRLFFCSKFVGDLVLSRFWARYMQWNLGIIISSHVHTSI